MDALLPVLPMLAFAADDALPGSFPSGPGWFSLILVYLLAVAAMLPWGALLGSVFGRCSGWVWQPCRSTPSPRSPGLFYPITALPGWLQVIGQVDRYCWIGRGLLQCSCRPRRRPSRSAAHGASG
ncbi:MAG: hypothetical protein R2719_14230 [Micropruina sp.]